MLGLDVASYQPRDLTPLIQQLQPEHVVVRLYIPGERPPPDHSWAQIESARANGCSVGGYVWQYSSFSPIGTALDAINCAETVGLDPPVYWIDIEPFTDGSIPTATQIGRCLDEFDQQGKRAGIYTGKWVWDRYYAGVTAFADRPLWSANYGIPPDDLSAGYGGWTEAQGHQFVSKPVDQSMFLRSVTG